MNQAAAHRHARVGLSARLPLDLRARGRGARRRTRSGGCAARKDNDYTAGVICAKVARYAERMHHPDRLLHPLRRTARKGRAASWETIAWDDALDLVAEAFLKAERRHGSEAVWPYYYAGTMGLVKRDGIHRLRHARSIRAFTPPSAPTRPIPGSPPASGASPGPTRARWRSPTSW